MKSVSAIQGVEADDINAPVKVYSISGVEIGSGKLSNRGMYIVKQGKKVRTVVRN